MATTAKGPTSRNMRLLAQHPLNGFGNCGEGMAIQLTRDRRRHSSRPWSWSLTSPSEGGPDSRRAPRDLSISGPMATTAKGPTSRNMRLLAQHPLNGFGNCGEGMAIQLTRDRRRVLWIAHESPPKNVTAVDVTDPRQPAVIAQTELPHDKMRSNSLDVVGNLLVVAYQTQTPGMRPAGFEI